MKFECPHCKRRLKIPDEQLTAHIGRSFGCPNCKDTIFVESPQNAEDPVSVHAEPQPEKTPRTQLETDVAEETPVQAAPGAPADSTVKMQIRPPVKDRVVETSDSADASKSSSGLKPVKKPMPTARVKQPEGKPANPKTIRVPADAEASATEEVAEEAPAPKAIPKAVPKVADVIEDDTTEAPAPPAVKPVAKAIPKAAPVEEPEEAEEAVAEEAPAPPAVKPVAKAVPKAAPVEEAEEAVAEAPAEDAGAGENKE